MLEGVDFDRTTDECVPFDSMSKWTSQFPFCLLEVLNVVFSSMQWTFC